jgi:hypothetical protein
MKPRAFLKEVLPLANSRASVDEEARFPTLAKAANVAANIDKTRILYFYSG